MKQIFKPAIAIALMAFAAGGAQAASTGAKAFQSECSACHMAFPPNLLPKQSWDQILATLDNHFGEDASLDASVVSDIRQYLDANAGRFRSVPNPPPLRITELRWFRGEHGRMFKRAKADPKIGTMSNCLACHRGGATQDND